MAGSNERGRSLEWVIVQRLQKLCASIGVRFILTPETQAANARDEAYLQRGVIDDSLLADFSACSDSFAKWIEEQGWLQGAEYVTIHRFTDAEGKKLGTSDIALEIKKGQQAMVKKISVKHHHDALKHPRLPSIPHYLGIADPKAIAAYKAKYMAIWVKFVSDARKIAKGKTLFADLKKINKSYVENKLYFPLNKLVVGVLEQHKRDKAAVRAFFSYFVSGYDFIVVKNERKGVLIKHFENMVTPSSMRRIEYPYKGRKTTIFIEFDNGWQVTFRLHNASSEYYRNGKPNITEKLDVICLNLEDVIKIEKLIKAKL